LDRRDAAPIVVVRAEQAGRVAGGMAAGGGGASDFSLAALVGFAGRLASAGAAAGLARGAELVETDCEARRFLSGPAAEISGEAIALYQDDARATWHVTLRRPGGATVAAITLTYAIVPAQNGAPAGPPAILEPSVADAGSGQNRLAARRRDQIAAAACGVIARKGFANATMREIADAAGLHVPTMYQYVASKDELLELVYNWTMANVRTDVAEAAAGCATAGEKLRATIASIIEKGDLYRHRIGVLNRETKSLSPAARSRVLAHYRKLLRQIADLVSEGTASGEFRRVEPEIIANLIDGLCDIWPLRQFAVGEFGRARFQAEVTDFVLAGLCSDNAPRPEERRAGEAPRRRRPRPVSV
jgi:AcrR family transcriptional regulator